MKSARDVIAAHPQRVGAAFRELGRGVLERAVRHEHAV